MHTAWKADARVVKMIEDQVVRNPTHRVPADKHRSLDWAGVLDEVKEGTEFGRAYQESALEVMGVKNRAKKAAKK